jgi:hypothetical protein
MNRDEILAMPAGREMDALIAEKVMGWTLGEPHEIHGWMMHGMVTVRDWVGSTNDAGITHIEKWSPSTDIAAAWEVVEKLGDKFDELERGDGGEFWMCVVYPDGFIPCVARAETAPLAICRAALLAMEA